MKVVSDPPIPKRRPDLTTFLHKPLEVQQLARTPSNKKYNKFVSHQFSALPRNFEAFADRPEKL